MDNTPGQGRVLAHTTQHQTWLQMVHLRQQADNQRLAPRGLGMELHTQAQGAVRAASAGVAEILAATHVFSGNEQAAKAWMKVAGRLSLVAGIIEGAYLIGKGLLKSRTPDKDSTYWTMGTCVFIVMGGLAAASSTGAVSIAGLTLGPVDWALIAIGLLGLLCTAACEHGPQVIPLNPIPT